MIIDSHAHLVAPPAFYGYRANLLASGGYYKGNPGVTDEALAKSAATNVATMDSVGTDVQLLCPRPFHQMQSEKPDRVVHWWIEANNDLIARTVAMHPNRFAGVAGLPVCAGSPVTDALPELDRAVNELGFVGVSLNPDPYEGRGNSPTLDQEYWHPLWERMVELDVPALIHSSGCNSGRESYSEHFITEESIAVLTLLRGEVFTKFPGLRIIVSHGGGSVPYQIGRWQAEVLAPNLGGDPNNTRFEVQLRQLYFDTVLHNPLSLELLFKTVGADRCLFGTEKPGSGSAINPDTGASFDDLKPVIEAMDFLSQSDRDLIFEGNARSVFPRLKIDG
ncbi:amidohydrolase family protein [Rugosimonospora africana]|uniref:4-oxalomesaconate hydratase n=1 Tax=Rugosimonospora africana TaxID=556532 RepID=A0A8J3QWF2_9ACTN|nr:amidohydrolase family protein [Rugosimonospora africana]GIH17791.1 4-oxalomesaconate hydratase [Rugosimonospora africana]